MLSIISEKQKRVSYNKSIANEHYVFIAILVSKEWE